MTTTEVDFTQHLLDRHSLVDIISADLQITCWVQCGVKFAKWSVWATGMALSYDFGGHFWRAREWRSCHSEGVYLKIATRGDVHVEEIRLFPSRHHQPTSRGSLSRSPLRERVRERQKEREVERKREREGTTDDWDCSCCSLCLSASDCGISGKEAALCFQAPVRWRELVHGQTLRTGWAKEAHAYQRGFELLPHFEGRGWTSENQQWLSNRIVRPWLTSTDNLFSALM